METKNIYQKLYEAKQEIGKVAKNAKNPHFKNTYASLEQIYFEIFRQYRPMTSLLMGNNISHTK